MSLPLEPLSLPLDLASMSLDLSMPAAEPDLADTVRVSVGAGGAAGSAPLLAGSLVAGLSALAVGAVACLVTRRRRENARHESNGAEVVVPELTAARGDRTNNAAGLREVDLV